MEGDSLMLIIGIDAHKRTHTAVAVEALGRQLGQKTIGVKSSDHLELLAWGGPPGQPGGSGRSRTAVAFLGAWSTICSLPASESCGCRRS
jgi:hypothetical protein